MADGEELFPETERLDRRLLIRELASIMADSTSAAAANISPAGAVYPSTATFVTGTPVVGTDNTAEAILTRTLPANSLSVVGDRIRLRPNYQATAGPNITGTLTLNGVPVADRDINGTNIAIISSWLHYVDATHANLIEEDGTSPTGALSGFNVAGFDWANDQTILFSQSAVAVQHLTIGFLGVDIFPKGTR